MDSWTCLSASTPRTSTREPGSDWSKDVLLDLYVERTAVGIFPGDVWPHEQLEGDKRDRCAFHTIPENVPNSIDEAELFIKTINEASDVDDDYIARCKKEVIGAKFGRFDLPEETCLNASDDHPRNAEIVL